MLKMYRSSSPLREEGRSDPSRVAVHLPVCVEVSIRQVLLREGTPEQEPAQEPVLVSVLVSGLVSGLVSSYNGINLHKPA